MAQLCHITALSCLDILQISHGIRCFPLTLFIIAKISEKILQKKPAFNLILNADIQPNDSEANIRKQK